MWILCRSMRHSGGKRGNTGPARIIGRLAAVLTAVLVCMPWAARAQQTAGASENTSSAAASAPNIAWYYGDKPPVGQLRAFDAVVVEPDHGFDPSQFQTPSTQWFA